MKLILLAIGISFLICGTSFAYSPISTLITAKQMDEAAFKKSDSDELRLGYELLSGDEMEKLYSEKRKKESEHLEFIPTIKLKVENAGENERFSLYSKKLDNKVHLLLKNVTAEKISSLHIEYPDFMLGESAIFAIISMDVGTVAAFEIVPFPIIATQGDRSISITMLDPRRTIFAVSIKGFSPGEKVITMSESMGELIESSAIIPPNGLMTSISMPAVIGHKSGTCTQSVQSVDMDKPLEVKFSWGKTALCLQGKLRRGRELRKSKRNKALQEL